MLVFSMGRRSAFACVVHMSVMARAFSIQMFVLREAPLHSAYRTLPAPGADCFRKSGDPTYVFAPPKIYDRAALVVCRCRWALGGGADGGGG